MKTLKKICSAIALVSFALILFGPSQASAQYRWTGCQTYSIASNNVPATTGVTNITRLDFPNHVGNTVFISITYSNMGAGTSAADFHFKYGSDSQINTNTGLAASDVIIGTVPTANAIVTVGTNLTVNQAPYLWFTRATNVSANAITNIQIKVGYVKY